MRPQADRRDGHEDNACEKQPGERPGKFVSCHKTYNKRCDAGRFSAQLRYQARDFAKRCSAVRTERLRPKMGFFRPHAYGIAVGAVTQGPKP
jgi:hypothetical protein